MILLKIGSLNIPKERWLDALNVFDEIVVFCDENEKEIEHPQIRYIKYNSHRLINRVLTRFAMHYSAYQDKAFLCRMAMRVLRLLNPKIIHEVYSTSYSFIHSSYNDFDNSAFLTGFLNPPKYTRAQKETRLSYSFFEMEAFNKAQRVVLNDPLNKAFYETKYGSQLFLKKEMIYGIDEDFRSEKVINRIRLGSKLSKIDGKVHAVILAGRVLSDPNNARSGGRLYYIDLIKQLLGVGIIVHLHTGSIIEYQGENPYKEIEKRNDHFYIEEKLDFINDTENAYRILSRYDLGVCHAHMPDSDVTVFDRVNIPHRYYEYHLAHVVPFDLRGKNYLLEKKAKQGFALIYNDFKEVRLEDMEKVKFETPTFSEYIGALYSNSQ